MFYIVSTPIGNLGDFSTRAIKILSSCDYVLCEDTRHSKILLSHYKIDIACKSYHRFNESSLLKSVITDLKAGKNIALISDAGTPLISDPGKKLIEACQKEKIAYTAIPGASSVLNALVLFGGVDKGEFFQFMGFFPKKEGELKNFIKKMVFYPGISIAFLAPSCAQKVFSCFDTLFKEHKVTLIREMTKIHESVEEGRAGDFLKNSEKFLGEMVIVTQGFEKPSEDFSLEEMVEFFQRFYLMSEKEALLASAKIKKVRKQEYFRNK